FLVVLWRPCHDLFVRLKVCLLLSYHLCDRLLRGVVYRYNDRMDVVGDYDRADDGSEPTGHSGTAQGYEELRQGALGDVPAGIPGRSGMKNAIRQCKWLKISGGRGIRTPEPLLVGQML